ncbi:MAG: enoyl-CoA hydratase/isomerase family protein [Chloroflexota bacterium]
MTDGLEVPLTINKQDNGVVIITFNRPDVLNALDFASMIAFWHTICSLESDDSLRVLILTGAGDKAFSSGGDLNELRDKVTEADARFFTHIMTDALHRMENLAIPVIGAINGYALGGGSEIALACDMRIVDANAKIGMVQIKMGLTPGWGAGQRLLRLVGYSKAMQLLLQGEILGADDLLKMGLANEKVEQGQALASALTLANQIAERPPKVVRRIKQLLRAGLTMPHDQARQLEFDLFPELWADEPHLQAVEAFFQHQASKSQETD